MRGLRQLACVLAFGLLIVACGSTSASGPPEINYGRDICIECGMIIDDPRFAAAYRLDDGTEKKFDDLGGLVLSGRDAGVLDEATVWVSDFENEELIDAATAYYVPTLGVASPMGHGILAFEDEAKAQAMAESLDGEVLLWDQVIELPVVDGLVGLHHDEGMGNHEMDDEDMEGHDMGDDDMGEG